MPRFTLIRFDRYDTTQSIISHHDLSTTNLVEAFKQTINKLWGGEDFEWVFKKIKENNNKVGMDFEEESYLFFEN